jgi:hypothetical protein
MLFEVFIKTNEFNKDYRRASFQGKFFLDIITTMVVPNPKYYLSPVFNPNHYE